MAVIELTAENFDKVLAENETVLCDFWASWCGPCRMVSPVIDEIGEQTQSAAVGKINVDEQPSLAAKFGIASIPTVIVFKRGVEASRAIGVRSKDEYLKML